MAVGGCTGTTEPVCNWGIGGTLLVSGIPSNVLSVTLSLNGKVIQNIAHTSPQQVIWLLVPETCLAKGEHRMVVRIGDQVQPIYEYTVGGAIAAVRMPGRDETLVFDVNRKKIMATGDTVQIRVALP